MGYDEYNEVIEQYQTWLNQGTIEIKPYRLYEPFGYTETEPGKLNCKCDQELSVVETAQGSMIESRSGISVVVKRLACSNCHKQYVLKLETVGGIP